MQISLQILNSAVIYTTVQLLYSIQTNSIQTNGPLIAWLKIISCMHPTNKPGRLWSALEARKVHNCIGFVTTMTPNCGLSEYTVEYYFTHWVNYYCVVHWNYLKNSWRVATRREPSTAMTIKSIRTPEGNKKKLQYVNGRPWVYASLHVCMSVPHLSPVLGKILSLVTSPFMNIERWKTRSVATIAIWIFVIILYSDIAPQCQRDNRLSRIISPQSKQRDSYIHVYVRSALAQNMCPCVFLSLFPMLNDTLSVTTVLKSFLSTLEAGRKKKSPNSYYADCSRWHKTFIWLVKNRLCASPRKTCVRC